MKSIDYRPDYLKRLKSPRYATELLKTSFRESCHDGDWESFGSILEDIITAQGSKKAFAKKIGISRQHLDRLFAKGANPTLRTLLPILESLGLTLAIDTRE